MAERFVQCINCGYIITWLEHSQLRTAVDCKCGAKKQFGPDVYVKSFKGFTWKHVIRRQAERRA